MIHAHLKKIQLKLQLLKELMMQIKQLFVIYLKEIDLFQQI